MSRISPILFNTEMVRAILDERKTATRRICKDGNDFTVPDMSFYDADKRTYAVHSYANKEHTDKLSLAERICPICPSDILYVRETWNYVYDMDENDKIIEDTGRYVYYADGPMQFTHWVDTNTGEHKDFMPWRPSIHMPKQAARIWLKVNNVYVQHINDMTLDDFLKEGVVIRPEAFNDPENAYLQAKEEFQRIWESTLKGHDKECYMWDENPWIWAIEFERCKKPEEGWG